MANLLSKADWGHRLWMLGQYADKRTGQVRCFITKKLYHMDDVHVAHLVPRSNMYLRFGALNNTQFVNKKSNVWDDMRSEGSEDTKHIQQYKKAYSEAFGIDKLEMLFDTADLFKNYNRSNDQLRELITKYSDYLETFTYDLPHISEQIKKYDKAVRQIVKDYRG